MPKTKSNLTIKARRKRAFEMFNQGFNDSQVRDEIGVTRQTVQNYRRKYEEAIQQQASERPDFLRQMLANTMRALAELDQIRADAWAHMKPRKARYEFTCKHCERRNVVKVTEEPSDQVRAQYQNVLLKAQDQRAKLMGLLGVKHEVLVAVTQVKVVQDKMLEWMGRNLCAADRERLAQFLETPEMMGYMTDATPVAALGPGVIDVEEVAG